MDIMIDNGEIWCKLSALIMDKDRLNRAFLVQGLPLGCWIDLHSMMKLWKHDNEAKIGQQVIKRFQNAESFVRLWPMQDNPGKQFSRICRGFL